MATLKAYINPLDQLTIPLGIADQLEKVADGDSGHFARVFFEAGFGPRSELLRQFMSNLRALEGTQITLTKFIDGLLEFDLRRRLTSQEVHYLYVVTFYVLVLVERLDTVVISPAMREAALFSANSILFNALLRG